MSQAFNHVKWCINKAKKEIEVCKKKGTSIKHRGLVEINSDTENAKKHIEKAEHNLKAITYLLDGNFSDTSIGMIFYSMYHCFLAIALKFGYETRNQTCTISLMEYLKEEGKIDIDSKFIEKFKYSEKKEESIIELREEYTYGIDVSTEDEEIIKSLVEDCKVLIESTKEIVYS